MIIPDTSTFRLYYVATTGGSEKYDESNDYDSPSDPSDAGSGTHNYRTLYADVTVPANYELQLEEQFTEVPWDTHDIWTLYVVTGSFSGAEQLKMEVWDGAWDDLGALSASTTNSFTVTAYVTSEDVYIRFHDGTTSGDTTQNTWQIDSVYLTGTDAGGITLPVFTMHYLKMHNAGE
jgi:hypothetical protein